MKQKIFADEYIKTGNATQAALKAGYAKKTAYAQGAKTLKKRHVRAYIEEKTKDLQSDTIMGAKEALEQLTLIARGELETTKVFNTKDGPLEVKVKPDVSEITRAASEILKRYPVSDLEKAQIKQAKANAIKAQAEAEVAKAESSRLKVATDSSRKKMEHLSTEDLKKLANIGDDLDETE